MILSVAQAEEQEERNKQTQEWIARQKEEWGKLSDEEREALAQERAARGWANARNSQRKSLTKPGEGKD